MKHKLIIGLMLLVMIGCQDQFEKKSSIRFRSTEEIDLGDTPVYRVTYFASDSNTFIISDRTGYNALVFEINETSTRLIKSYKISEEDWLQSVAIKGNCQYLIYNDSVIVNGTPLALAKHDSLHFYHINSLFLPIVEDSLIYLENNCSSCLSDPLYCKYYTPEVVMNTKTGIVEYLPVSIPVKEIGQPFMKADVYSTRTIVGNKHYYSFANSSKIFVYDTYLDSLWSSDSRSLFQKQDFFTCAYEDTSDYVSYLIQNQICSPLYTGFVYNNQQQLFFRLFNQEQDLFKPNHELNDLENRKYFIQVINHDLSLIGEEAFDVKKLSHFMLTYGNQLIFLNIKINEYGKPILQINRFNIV